MYTNQYLHFYDVLSTPISMLAYSQLVILISERGFLWLQIYQNLIKLNLNDHSDGNVISCICVCAFECLKGVIWGWCGRCVYFNHFNNYPVTQDPVIMFIRFYKEKCSVSVSRR